MPSEEEKEKINNYLNNRLKDYEMNIHELKKRYRIVKVFFGATMIITITSGTVIASLSSTVLPPPTSNNNIGYGRFGFVSGWSSLSSVSASGFSPD